MSITNTLLHETGPSPALGNFLRGRRAKLDAASLGFRASRRRTPGLRREEVAQRANISSAWYVCLEQGRGGAPSAEVLDNLAKALLLTNAEREHLFLIGLGRAPENHYRQPDALEPRLQRILDSMSPAPAFIKTATWNVVAWNQATTAVLMPKLPQLALQERNTLRFVFLDPCARSLYCDWQTVARTSVAAFRADVARAGAMDEVAPLVDELSRSSAAFRTMWKDNDVLDLLHTVKHVRHPVLGKLSFECSAFGVDGRQDLTMILFLPASTDVAKRITKLLKLPKLKVKHSNVPLVV